MQTMINKRSIVIAGHKTSVSLEDPFWNALKDIGRNQEMTLSKLIGDIDTQRQNGNLSSAIRLFVLAHFRGPAASDVMAPRASVPQGVSQAPQGNGSTLA